MAPRRDRTPSVRQVDLSPGTFAVLGASVLVVVGLIGLARTVPRTLSAVAVGSIVALGLQPLVSVVGRRLRLPRAAAVALVLVATAVAVGGLAALLVPAAAEQAETIDQDLTEAVTDLGELPVVGDRLADARVPERIDRFLERLPERMTGEDTPVFRGLRSVAGGVAAGGLTLLLVVALLVDGERLASHARRLVPAPHRSQAERLAAVANRVVGRYVAGSLLVAVVAGVVTLALGIVLRVPLSPLLALWVMAWDLVPQVGGAAGGIPFVLMGFTQGPMVGLGCAVAFVLYLQIENHVITPLLVGQAVRLSPLATMTAALIGVSAGGVVGALLAVPLTGAAKAIYLEARSGPATTAPAAVS